MEATSHSTRRHNSRRQQHHRTMRTEVDNGGEFDDLGTGEGFPSAGERPKQKKPLNFYQAMSDFKAMFPHIDSDVIEAVLRANDGVVQTTIDQLLVLSESTDETDGEGHKNDHRLPNYHESQTYEDDPPPAYSEVESQILNEFAQESQDISNHRRTQSPESFGSRPRHRNWNPPLLGPLPHDFLRFSDDPLPSNSNSLQTSAMATGHSNRHTETNADGFISDRELEQFLEDEKLAMFLQNEEFMRQLRHDPDFLLSLEEDHKRFLQSQTSPSPVAEGASPPSDHTPNTAHPSGARPRHSTASHHDEAAFNTKLKHMGKTTRKKLGKLAKRFSRKKHPKFNPLVAGSTANLLDEESDEEDTENAGLCGIQEDVTEDSLEPEPQYGKPANESTGGRRLPQVPGQSKTNDEPIVFYSEDNEFQYKSD